MELLPVNEWHDGWQKEEWKKSRQLFGLCRSEGYRKMCEWHGAYYWSLPEGQRETVFLELFPDAPRSTFRAREKTRKEMVKETIKLLDGGKP